MQLQIVIIRGMTIFIPSKLIIIDVGRIIIWSDCCGASCGLKPHVEQQRIHNLLFWVWVSFIHVYNNKIVNWFINNHNVGLAIVIKGTLGLSYDVNESNQVSQPKPSYVDNKEDEIWSRKIRLKEQIS